ncbi:MAG: AraC family transcriptional regulator ligand-binding domain-containing protein [Halioglobus sp.]
MTKQASRAATTPDTIASYLLPIVKALDSRGIDSESLLSRAGVPGNLANDPTARVAYTRMGEVFRLAAEETGDAQFGLYASRYMLPSHIHALGTALLASSSLMDFCVRIERFGPFLGNTVSFYVDRADGETKFSAYRTVPLRTEAVDMFWAFVLRFMRHLDCEKFNPLRVDIPGLDSQQRRKAYSDFYRCPLSFGCEEFALFFDTKEIEKQLPTASTELAQLSEEVIRNYLARLDKADIVSQVSRLLVKNLPNGDYTKEHAANELSMSSRTLQNRLRGADTTWREMVDATRYTLAVSYLEGRRYTLGEITYMLGFNDSSSFSRAFKRWAGCAPGEFLPTTEN